VLRMKAIIFEQYGSPNVLKLAEVDKPVATDHQVLIKVRAAAVNPADYQAAQGDVRFLTGIFKPKKRNRIGYDVAGVVEATGEKVTQFKPGDAVFGSCSTDPTVNSQAAWIFDFGSFAEYTVTHEAALAPKPANLSFEQAAATPTTGWVALQGLCTAAKVQAGDKVLISSATGGIGTFAVQIAKAMGAEVTGVCSTKNIELVRSLGADNVVDYTKEDYTKQGRRYDLIFDSVGEHPLSTLRSILNPGGAVIIVAKRTGGSFLGFVLRILSGVIMSPFVRDRIAVDYSRPNQDDLMFVGELLTAGKIKPVVEKCYSGLAEVARAVQHVAEGHAWGKIVITVQ